MKAKEREELRQGRLNELKSIKESLQSVLEQND
jgi:hypothetical protein